MLSFAVVTQAAASLLGRMGSNSRSSMPLVLICHSGNRSQHAAEVLRRDGLTGI